MLTGLIFGLVSSLHCIGMCGPIALMLPVSKDNQAKKVMQILTYHLGRISAYSILGLVFGVFGKGLFLAGLQQQMSIVVGILMIAFVLIPQSKLGKLNFMMPFYKFVSKIQRSLGNQFKKQTTASLYTIGFFNGFLPCGMVYVALFGALATQSLLYGTLYMALFGVGTIPLMSMMIYVREMFSVKVRSAIMKYYPIVIVIFGMLFIVRGLGLDIPFLSPDTLNLFVKADATC
ncbi:MULTISPECIES: sulfite exporter TauE/SafE family protein [Myroides]|uniref:Sulfite exporter TauE/SafE family protein n=1 Tax=Myroides albus TaxID=2562892 RepID=A0A6I3LNH4_9FLAO|nr:MULTISPECIES: sulfite exporter TauE/SafE family protein [Myroides]MTG98151.1 sulfite exporter TauE/SafE family protein [Myroides albus]MVX35419.1 sulfite exporter TauE/SafE family protein [Myroides sp. LoEW2-1]UVD81305.1 sulfite exporter TauE/SafE family protein [Myroides albus]